MERNKKNNRASCLQIFFSFFFLFLYLSLLSFFFFLYPKTSFEKKKLNFIRWTNERTNESSPLLEVNFDLGIVSIIRQSTEPFSTLDSQLGR